MAGQFVSSGTAAGARLRLAGRGCGQAPDPRTGEYGASGGDAGDKMSAVATQQDLPWHSLTSEEVLERLESHEEGLTEDEAAERLEAYGPNQLVVRRPVSAWKLLVDQVKSVVVLLLLAAAAVALLIGDLLEAAAIGAVLLINTLVGFWTEWRARQAMEGLRQLQVQEAAVVRRGEVRQIDARELVPGDVLNLEAGASVPADARLLRVAELRTVEAPLTGESLPVDKKSDALNADGAESVPLADRANMVYKGTLVATGSGRAVVVGTGGATEIGRVSQLVQETESERTPLEKRLDTLGKRLVWLVLGVAAIIAVVGILRGRDFWLMIETGIALAIAAVPEGLPAVATITLAVGVRRMARQRALVRRLAAVEALGSATVICADKTGTLTAGEMTVTTMFVGGKSIEVSGVGYEPSGEFRYESDGEVEPREQSGLEEALRIGLLANRARVEEEGGNWEAKGDPTEAALVVAALKGGLDRREERERWEEIGEVPFASERGYMATFHSTPSEGRVAFVKGAPERILELSTRWLGPDGTADVDEATRERLEQMNEALAGRGLRVLGLAKRELGSAEEPDEETVKELTFVGFSAMLDPPAEGVKETIDSFRQAGVRTVMITGDQEVTAVSVARDLGVLEEDEEALSGTELNRLGDAELVKRLAKVGTFSRVSPRDKLRIVEGYQGRGEIVGMLGDGVNDAAALKRADIGVAMGERGTDVAKETAEVVLQDDRFATIAAAVEEGRVIFDNIRKFIFYLFSCNVSEVLVIFIAGLSGLPIPLLPLQILWLNLVTDVFPALALAMEPPEPDVMRRPPRDPGAAILSKDFMVLVGSYGTLLTLSTLGVYLWGLKVWGVDVQHAVTLAFMTLALTQLFHVFNARAPSPVIFTRRMLQNGWVWGAIGLTIGLQFLAVYFAPLARVLDTYPLRPGDWPLVLTGSLVPLVAGQVWKAIQRSG